MMRAAVPILIALLLAASRAAGQVVPSGFAVEPLAQGLNSPTALQLMPDDRVLFAEQFTGRVRVFVPGFPVQSTPVLQLTDVTTDGGERGLLGVALDPAYPTRPYLYVHYTAGLPNRIRIARFTLANVPNGDGLDLVADPLSRYELIDDIPDQATNHNGGTVRFAADGLLYVSLGEDAQPCAAQDTTALRGKILRLDVSKLPPGSGRAFRGQITPFDNPFVSRPDSNARLVVALGLRNPFRIQPDPVRRWLVIGDVGDQAREELDVLVLRLPTPRPAQPEMGADYGWPFLEGSIPGRFASGCGPVPPNLSDPEFEYDRTTQLGGAAIIAAGAYWPTGSGLYDFPPEYSGNLFANDYYSGTLYRLEPFGSGFAPAPDVPGQPAPGKWGTGFDAVSDWALFRDGAFYFCRQSIGFAANSGVIGRIINTTPPPPPTPPLAIAITPVPAVGGANLVLSGVIAPFVLTIHDLNGRRVRRIPESDLQLTPGGKWRGAWDGRDDDGRAVHPGLFVARVESAGRTAAARVPFLR
jgi:glucose/arabinose dehydrogenase